MERPWPPLLKAMEDGNIEEVERLLQEGVDVNMAITEGNFPRSPFSFSIEMENITMIKLMLRYGADPTKAMLHGVSDLEIIKLLMGLGADINAIDIQGESVLTSDYANESIELIQFLLENGANVNYVNDDFTFIDMLFMDYILNDMNLDEQIYAYKAIDLALKYGADINLLNDEYKQLAENYIASPKWAGFTRDDYDMFQTIFGKNPQNYSQCPICLKHVERSEACMYMRHNCMELGGYYHKKLYNLYKNNEGNVYWCTICGRSAMGHRHYNLPKDYIMDEYEGSEDREEILPQLGPGRGDPFEKDCRLTNGGGGYPEKYIRFTTYITTAKKLNSVLGIMPDAVARRHLVEECFQAPRMDNFLISRNDFPKKISAPAEAPVPPPTPAANVRKPNANRDLIPRRLNRGLNSISLLDDVPVVAFMHRDTATGAVVAHGEDEYIGVDSLMEFIRDQTRNFAMPGFGYCYLYPQCKALLYPEDVREFLPEDVYNAYKLKFNEKFGGQRGGTRKPYISPYIQEATNATCVMPSRITGGHKTRRGRKNRRNTRSQKKK